MSLADYQKKIDDALQPFEKPYWAPLSQFARLAEEVGEVSRILNDAYGDKPKKSDEVHKELADELADVLFVVLALANSEGIALDEALNRSIDKLRTRDRDRFERKAQNEQTL